MNFKKPIIFLIIIIIAVSILLYLQNSSENKKSIFTENLDSMYLVSYKIGADAINEIYRLHGFNDNNFKIQNGYTAKYIDYEGNTATIWISESENHDHAYALLKSMNEKIGNNGMFTRPVETRIEDITVPTVYSVQGLDMFHYYYVKKNRVYWIALNHPNQSVRSRIVKETIIHIG